MRWIMTTKSNVNISGKKRRKGFVTQYPDYAAMVRAASGDVRIISEAEARQRAPRLFGDEDVAVVKELLANPKEEVLGEVTTKDDSEDDPVSPSVYEEMSHNDLKAWLDDNHPDEAVPRTKAERLDLVLALSGAKEEE